MSQLHLTDEILMAFADGELDEPVASAVAKAMSEDKNLAKRVVEFQQSRRVTRSAFSSALAPGVPPELHAAVSAQIKAFEAAGRPPSEPDAVATKEEPPRRRQTHLFYRMALAASIAAVSVGAGYFAGQQRFGGAGGLMAHLEDPAVGDVLSRSPSGSETQLSVGRMRVISTYRLADGSLCREFKLQEGTDAAQALACGKDSWRVAFAMKSSVPGAEYAPSGGDDPMATYLQTMGAGEPLVDAAEAKALADRTR